MLLRILSRRFDVVPSELAFRIRSLSAESLLQLVDVALMASSLDVVTAALASLAAEPGNGHGDTDLPKIA
jgi:hypothetical protein